MLSGGHVDDGDGLTETHGSAAADPIARAPADDPRSSATRSDDDLVVGRLLGSVEAALAEAATPRAALGALRADVDECRAAIDALRESHVALEREDGALTEAQGQMREELDDVWRTRLPRLERLMFRLADRMDRVVDEAARWVVAELKDQHARWKAVSGEGAQLHLRPRRSSSWS